MQPTAITVRPSYHHRPHRTHAMIPRGHEHGDLVDPLAPARGILIALLLSAALWAGIIAAFARFLR